MMAAEEKSSIKDTLNRFLGRKVPRAANLDRSIVSGLVKEGRVLFHENLARYTTMRVGGPADALVFPGSAEELESVLSYADRQKIPVFMLGGGSNLLVRDGGIRGIVISLRESFQGLEEIPSEANDKLVRLRVQSGFSTPKLVRLAAQRGWSGLEGLAGVVGTIGGAFMMNAGTRHGVLGDVVEAVHVINRSGQRRTLKREDLTFSYRECSLDRSWIVLAVELLLTAKNPEEVQKEVKEHLDYRQKTQPLSLPNAGSIFKNPKSAAAGELIERHGLKGVRLRGAQISDLHGNWIVNLGAATADDVFQLIDLIRERIREAEGIELETEIRIVGESRKAASAREAKS